MCYPQDTKNALRFADVGTALAGLILVACAVACAIVATVDFRPSLEAQQIISAGRTLAEQVGR